MDTLHKPPLYLYVIGVVVTWAVILGSLHFFGHTTSFTTFSLICAGFALGMISMYVAVHLYRWK